MNSRSCAFLFASTLLVATSACAPDAAPPPPERTKEQQFQDAAERQVGDLLKDPSSAQFDWGFTLPERDMGCGKVNSKNSFGAYTGFDDFCQIKGVTYLFSVDPKGYMKAVKVMTKAFTDEGIKTLDASPGMDAATKDRLRKKLERTH
jgi:hypothetical protein